MAGAGCSMVQYFTTSADTRASSALGPTSSTTINIMDPDLSGLRSPKDDGPIVCVCVGNG